MTEPHNVEEILQDDRDITERVADWIRAEAPSWLVSFSIHLGILLLVALIFGRTIYRKIVGPAPTFESAKVEKLADDEIERFEIGDTSADPSELTTESLTMKDPPGQKAQEALYYDDAPVFEEQGGGAMAGAEDGAGGLGFNIKAAGLGPVLHGGGGADLGKGEGASFGKGGAGEGFGGRGKGNREALLGRYGGTKQTERAVAGALNWLARHQNANGSWSIQRYKGRCKDGSCNGEGSSESDAGATALGLLPFLAAGQTHVSKGPYQKQIAKAVQWLVQNQKANGDLSDGAHQMYGHGLATIALCEAYGMSRDSALGRAAQKAVHFIEGAQNAQGGWRYTAGTNDSDTSVFGWQMMALKSAAMAGMSVDPPKLEAGRKWLATVHEGEHNPAGIGQFGYRVNAPPTPCMTAVAALIIQYLGADRNDPQVVGSVKYLMANLPENRSRNTYYWYYATQVMHNMTGAEWDAWNRNIRRILVDTQVKKNCATGSWDPEQPDSDAWGRLGGRLMLTSLSALTLEVYYRYLPLYRVDAEGKAAAKKPAAADAEEKPGTTKRAADGDEKPGSAKPAAAKDDNAADEAAKKDRAKE